MAVVVIFGSRFCKKESFNEKSVFFTFICQGCLLSVQFLYLGEYIVHFVLKFLKPGFCDLARVHRHEVSSPGAKKRMKTRGNAGSGTAGRERKAGKKKLV